MSRRLPSAVKALRGTARKDRVNASEPKPTLGVPPARVGLSAQAQRERRRLLRALLPMHVVTVSDGPALDLASEAFAEYHEARAVLARDGQSYECVTAAGAKMRRARPEQAIAADAMRRAAHLLEAFGLTPASRSKVEQVPPPRDAKWNGLLGDPLDEFAKRRPVHASRFFHD